MADDLSAEQQAVADGVESWLASGLRGWRLLTGPAGTGKTFVASRLGEGKRTLFCAMTGKAAGVLRSNGVDATTLHKAIYAPDEVMVDGKWQTRFVPKEGALDGIDLVVLDECSMATAQVATDLLSFGVPVLVLGDPAQLPPVGGPGYFDQRQADWSLTEIRRQALESGIIRLATDVREGRGVGAPDSYAPDCAVITVSEAALCEDRLLEWASDDSAAIIVGTHRMRHHFNGVYRAAAGVSSPLPVAGDRLLCLQNDHRRGLLNGDIWRALDDAVSTGPDTFEVTLRNDAGDVLRPECWKHEFDGRADQLDAMSWRRKSEHARFTFGYAITCHKMQGSAAEKCLVWDESYAFRDQADRWLYTAVTRAQKQLILVRRD